VPALPRLIPARELKEAEVEGGDTELGSMIDTVYRAGETEVHCLDYWKIFESIVSPVNPERAGATNAT
jgi:hypothetical protein